MKIIYWVAERIDGESACYSVRERTKKAAVTKALEEFIARREQRQILQLMGKLDWDPCYDYKAERRRS